jgi:hypothetical protein
MAIIFCDELNMAMFQLFTDMKGKIRVFCRLRPLNDKELSFEEKNIVCSPDEFTIAHPWKDEKSKQHIYDRVFDANTSQEEVFEDTKVNTSNAIFHVDAIINVNFISKIVHFGFHMIC